MKRYCIEHLDTGFYVWSDGSINEEPQWFSCNEALAIMRGPKTRGYTTLSLRSFDFDYSELA
jgi:hypothetical protein